MRVAPPGSALPFHRCQLRCRRSFTLHRPLRLRCTFVQTAAYRGCANKFAVVRFASKPIHAFGRPRFKYEWVPISGNASVRVKAFKMLPDWGYSRVLTVVVVKCTFSGNPNADNSGGKLVVYTYHHVRRLTPPLGATSAAHHNLHRHLS